MNNEEIIRVTIDFVKEKLNGAEGGHDWWHIYRVWNLSKLIAENEEVNLLVVELGALLHDIADPKFNNGNETEASELILKFLSKHNVDSAIIANVILIVENISFKGGNAVQKHCSNELNVVQDADRLDAIGAIGIARTFNYGGFKNRELYNPEIKPQFNMTKDEYRLSTAPTINHFYEKLLLLKNRMNTAKGRELAEERHRFMEFFLEEFYSEWEGRK